MRAMPNEALQCTFVDEGRGWMYVLIFHGYDQPNLPALSKAAADLISQVKSTDCP